MPQSASQRRGARCAACSRPSLRCSVTRAQVFPKHWTLPHVLPSVGRELECKQIRTSLLTVSLTSLRVWVINGARDFGQLECVVGQLNHSSSSFHCGFLYDGHAGTGGGAAEGLAAVGVQISSALVELSAREREAMFTSIYSVTDWLKQRMDKPKLLVRALRLTRCTRS